MRQIPAGGGELCPDTVDQRRVRECLHPARAAQLVRSLPQWRQYGPPAGMCPWACVHRPGLRGASVHLREGTPCGLVLCRAMVGQLAMPTDFSAQSSEWYVPGLGSGGAARHLAPLSVRGSGPDALQLLVGCPGPSHREGTAGDPRDLRRLVADTSRRPLSFADRGRGWLVAGGRHEPQCGPSPGVRRGVRARGIGDCRGVGEAGRPGESPQSCLEPHPLCHAQSG
mmetsp:Transcript_65509/g.165045  ORF Transcript_65509/g.165045 Transcript_65509/m.165045 type:complete len:226 (+) Transcript_65509:211-888(+)